MQEEEKEEMLEMDRNAEATKTTVQNRETNGALDVIQNDDTIESRECTF